MPLASSKLNKAHGNLILNCLKRKQRETLEL